MKESNLSVSPLLTAAAVNYKNRAFVAHLLAPIVMVPRLLFSRVVFDRASRFKPADLSYGKNMQANILDIEASKVADKVEKTALAWLIDPEEEEETGAGPGIVGPGFDVQVLKTDIVMEQHLLNREMLIAALLRDTAQNPNNTTLVGAAQWSDDASNPGKDVSDASDSMLMKPNVFWGGRQVISRLRQHPKILDTTKYTVKGKVPMEALAEYFEVDEIIVGDAFYDSAKRGQAEIRTKIWGGDAGLMYRNPNPQPLMEQPSAMYLFQRMPGGAPRPLGGGNGQSGSGFRVYMGAPHPSMGTSEGSVYGKVEKAEAPRIVASEATFLFKNAI
jgi:hypothetical protein